MCGNVKKIISNFAQHVFVVLQSGRIHLEFWFVLASRAELIQDVDRMGILSNHLLLAIIKGGADVGVAFSHNCKLLGSITRPHAQDGGCRIFEAGRQEVAAG